MPQKKSRRKRLIINGIAVDPDLLERRPIRRCKLGECQAYCCGWGASVSVEQADDILAHAELIQPHLPPERRDPGGWFEGDREPERDHPDGGTLTSTAIVKEPTHPTGYNCVFLRPDRMCALQAAALAAGERPWRFKPYYCASHPVTFTRHVVTLDDANPLYKRGGNCQRGEPEAVIPVYRLFEPEVKLLLGENGYAQLEALAHQRS